MTKIIINRNNKAVHELRKVVKNQNLRGYYKRREAYFMALLSENRPKNYYQQLT